VKPTKHQVKPTTTISAMGNTKTAVQVVCSAQLGSACCQIFDCIGSKPLLTLYPVSCDRGHGRNGECTIGKNHQSLNTSLRLHHQSHRRNLAARQKSHPRRTSCWILPWSAVDCSFLGRVSCLVCQLAVIGKSVL